MRALVLAPLLLAVACAQVTPRSPDAAPSEQAYREAVELVPTDPEGAEAALEALVREYPRSPRADDARYQLARLKAARGAEAAAVADLDWNVRQHPRGDQVDRSRLLLAELERDRGRLDTAVRVASAIRPRNLEPRERLAFYRLNADLALRREQPARAVRWLARIVEEGESPIDVRSGELELDRVLASLSRTELDALAEELGGRPPAARVLLAAAERAMALEADYEGAEARLAAAERAGLSPSEQRRHQRLAARSRALQGLTPVPVDERLPGFAELGRLAPPSTAGAAGTLGVVLPLSGRFARYGQETLRGLMLAVGLFAPDGDGPRVRLVVRDSQGEPERAAAAVAELGADPAVQAVIGPLRADAAERAADAADTWGVPLLALTARESVAREHPQAFRLALTPRSQVERLVDHAMDELAATRAAILHPRDAWGHGLKDLFWDAIEARGGTVVGLASYPPDATDFRDAIRRLAGFLLLTPAEKEVLRERDRLLSRAKRLPPEEAAELRLEAAELTGPDEAPLPPIVDFDVLFVPDDHARVELIAPQLAFHELAEPVLLGTSGWNHPDLVRIAGRHVEGAVFTEPFHGDSRFAFVADFDRRYRERFGEAPGPLAAQAFDAANLVLVQLDRGLTTRPQVREGLLAVRAFPGASGVTAIDPDGNARKRPFLLGVRDGEVVSLD